MSFESGERTPPEADWSSTPAGAAATPHLFLLVECDAPERGGAKLAFTGLDEIRIGRGPNRAVSFDHVDGARRATLTLAAPSMSAEHVHITRHGLDWFVYDLKSTNGTRVNGSRIERTALTDGDLLELGRVWFRFRSKLVPFGRAAAGFDSGEDLDSLLPDLSRTYAALAKVALSRLPVIVGGETGAGKEVAARAIHSQSRRPGPFVAVNCAAIPPALVEATLFGHIRGAFSGAGTNEPGLVRAADRGTLLLDEIGEMPLPAQTALLRVLQENEVLPLGATRPVKIDVRFIAATHKPLREFVDRGRFRADLFARLNGYAFDVPPLRGRTEDFGVLLRNIILRTSSSVRFTSAASRALLAYRWPMNVRELEQVVARALILADGRPIDVGDLPHEVEVANAQGQHAGGGKKELPVRESLERQLAVHRGNVTLVARAMHKAPTQIYRWLKRFQIDPTDYRMD